ncbi:MAG: RND family efflux transporter MFP subunit [Lysobacterales bacterium]|jgi:RND family efflux transporter MFP subunit
MQKYFRFFLPVGLVALSIAVVLIMINIQKGNRPEKKEVITPAVLVKTIDAELKSLNFVVHSQGTVRPRTKTTLVAEVSGKVEFVSPHFVAGGFFRKGDVLLEIDASDYRTALKRAEAGLASRQARLSDETARSEQALKDWKNLGKTGTPSALVLRKPQLQDAQANVSAAEADVEKARRDLQRTRITIPYDGLLQEKSVDIGQYVTPGTRLGVSFAIDTAEVRLPISKDDLPFLLLPSISRATEVVFPTAYLVTIEAGRERRWQAEIIRTEGVVDEASRVVYAVAQVVDPYGILGQSEQEELKIGTFVAAEIEGTAVENVVVLPRYALQSDHTVLVANAERKLEVRQVTLVREEPNLVYISSGVQGGEKVVITNLDAPIPGMQLAVDGEPAAKSPVSETVQVVAGTDGEG